MSYWSKVKLWWRLGAAPWVDVAYYHDAENVKAPYQRNRLEKAHPARHMIDMRLIGTRSPRIHKVTIRVKERR